MDYQIYSIHIQLLFQYLIHISIAVEAPHIAKHNLCVYNVCMQLVAWQRITHITTTGFSYMKKRNLLQVHENALVKYTLFVTNIKLLSNI